MISFNFCFNQGYISSGCLLLRTYQQPYNISVEIFSVICINKSQEFSNPLKEKYSSKSNDAESNAESEFELMLWFILDPDVRTPTSEEVFNTWSI